MNVYSVLVDCEWLGAIPYGHRDPADPDRTVREWLAELAETPEEPR